MPPCARVVVLPQLAAVLKEPRKMLLSHGLYRADAFGFVTANGGPLYCRNVAERGVEPPKARRDERAAGRASSLVRSCQHAQSALG